MTPQHKAGFVDLLVKTYLVFDKEPDAKTLDIWWDLLCAYHHKDIAKAFEMHIKKGKFAPRPSDILDTLSTFAKEGSGGRYEVEGTLDHSGGIKTQQRKNLPPPRPKLTEFGKHCLEEIKKSDFFTRKI